MDFQQLDKIIEEHMNQAHVPAVALAVVNEQEILYPQGYGQTSVEEGGTPVSTHTLFRIGSVTKPLVGTSVMRLVENGLLDLDQPLISYIEWLRFSNSHMEELITLRMLLSHTGGLPKDSYSGSGDADGLERYVREHIHHYSFVAPPGRLYSYANAGFSLVGYIAQVVTGKRFPDLMQELVFDPLEMNRTTFDPLMAMTYPFALPHILREDQLRVLHHVSYGQAIAPAGGAYSTVVDLAHFAMMHLQHGRFHDQQLLSTSSILHMQTQQAVRYLTHAAGYGLSFELMTYKGVSCFGHSGSFSTFGSQLLLFPDKYLAFILIVSRMSFMKRLVRELIDYLLDLPSESQRPGSANPKRTQWSRYTGSFLGARAGLALISVKDNHLVLELNNRRLTLQEHSTNVYFGYLSGSVSEIAVGFIPEAMKPVRYITIDEKLFERFERDPFFSPNPLSWVRFIGTYKEDGSGETITFQVTNSQMLLRFQDNDDDMREDICIPISETRFTWSGGLIEFQVAEDGTVPALKAMNVYELRRLCA